MRCPSPGRPSSGAGSQGSATRVSRVRSMRAWGPSTGPTACALAGRRCSLWGWRKGVPGGGAFHHCEGRLVSGAVPPPTARPLERAVRVPRPVCPGCGRCRRGDPAPVPQRAPLLAGVARCGSGRRASPGGGAFHRCEGRPVSGAVPPLAARPLERAARVPRPVCPGCGRCGRGDPAPAPQRAPLRAGVARCGGGGRASPGGVPSTIVRGAWCQALSPPRPSVLWSGQPGFRVPCVPGAVGAGVGTQHRSHSVRPLRAGVARCGGGGRASPGGVLSSVVGGARCRALSLPWPPVLWSGQPGFRVPCVPGAVGAGVGTQHRPHSVRPCGPALLAVGVAEGRPRGGCFLPLRGASGVRPCPSPGRPSSGAGSQGSASRVSRVRSVRVWGSSTSPAACALAGRCCSLWVWRKGVPGGGAFHHCEGRLVSGAVPSPAARPLERAARVPRPVCPRSGRCGRGDPAPAPQRAPLRAGVARCGGGGRASPRGVPSTVVRGAWCQALSLPRPPVLWSRQPGFRVPCVPGAVDAGVWTHHQPHSVRPCGPALLAVGVAEGRPGGGCLPPL